MLEDKPLVELRFPAGKNNVSRETEMPSGSARELLNVDLTDSGELSRRKGYTSVYSSPSERIHSLYNAADVTVFMQGTTLKRLNPDYTTTDIRTGLDPDNPMSYFSAVNRIFYSNGDDTGVVTASAEHAEWGVDAPVGQPLALPIAGALEKGTYQIAVTYLSALGEESGATRATTSLVPSGGGINLFAFPQSTAASINIYVSSPDSDQLYWQANIPMGQADYEFTSLTRGRMLETQFLERMPPGQIVRGFHGRMWVAAGNILLFSPALRYGLYDPRHNYFQFPVDIDIVEAASNGLYVTADKTYFLSGTNPMEMSLEEVYSYPGVRGTGMQVPESKFDADNPLISDSSPEDVAFWYSTHGAVLGYPDGKIHPITEDRLSMPEYGSGATLLREEDGIRQLVTSLTKRGDPNAFGVADYAVAEVRRNGVLI